MYCSLESIEQVVEYLSIGGATAFDSKVVVQWQCVRDLANFFTLVVILLPRGYNQI